MTILYDENGNAYTATNPVPVDGTIQLTGSLGATLRYFRSGALAASTTEVIFDLNKPIVIERIEWSTNKLSNELQIVPYVGSVLANTGIGELVNDGSATVVNTPSNIASYGSVAFEIIDHNTTTNKYKYVAKNLRFPDGAKISIVNHEVAGITVAVKVFGGKYDD